MTDQQPSHSQKTQGEVVGRIGALVEACRGSYQSDTLQDGLGRGSPVAQRHPALETHPKTLHKCFTRLS